MLFKRSSGVVVLATYGSTGYRNNAQLYGLGPERTLVLHLCKEWIIALPWSTDTSCSSWENMIRYSVSLRRVMLHVINNFCSLLHGSKPLPDNFDVDLGYCRLAVIDSIHNNEILLVPLYT